MDIVLLIVVIILALVLVGLNIYLLAYYSHPDDEGFGVSIWPKIIAVLGLTLAFAQILILPLDVSNTRGEGAGFDIYLLWQIVFISVAVYIVFLAPFSLFYYEAEDEDEVSSKISHAVKMELFLLVILAILFASTYFFFSEADIPIYEITIKASNLQLSELPVSQVNGGTTNNLTLDVSFPIYIIAVFSWFGWWFFVIYAGVGLIALPLDLILEYKNRPKRMRQAEFVKARQDLATELVELKNKGEQIRVDDAEAKRATGWWASRRKRNAVRDGIRKFEISVTEVNKKFELLKLQADYNRRVHPLLYALKLVLGFIFIIVSIIWVLHIIIYMLVRFEGVPKNPFLNMLFIWLEERNTGFLAVIFFGFFAYYMLWACIKGNIKFGIRFFCFTFYPMLPNETFMNSFIVNVLLFNLWSVALTHFCTIAFADYARLTDANLIFTVQLQHMNFFKYFWEKNVFIYALVIWAGITAIYFMFVPSDRFEIAKMKLADRNKTRV